MAESVSKPEVSASDRVAAALRLLVPAAEKLTSASNSLSKPVLQLEASLKRLNLGVPCWTTIKKAEEDEHGNYSEWAVGYARYQGLWGIVVKQTVGNNRSGQTAEDLWHFEDAPRFIKTRAVDALPALVEGLATVTDKTADKLLRKVPTAESIATAAAALLDQKKKK